MHGDSVAPAELVAPSWARWAGVAGAVLAAIAVGLTAQGHERTAGLALAAVAAALWIGAVLLGAVKIRRRGQEVPIWVVMTRVVTMVVIATSIISAVPALQARGLALHAANFLSAALCGMAIGCAATWAISRRPRPSR